MTNSKFIAIIILAFLTSVNHCQRQQEAECDKMKKKSQKRKRENATTTKLERTSFSSTTTTTTRAAATTSCECKKMHLMCSGAVFCLIPQQSSHLACSPAPPISNHHHTDNNNNNYQRGQMYSTPISIEMAFDWFASASTSFGLFLLHTKYRFELVGGGRCSRWVVSVLRIFATESASRGDQSTSSLHPSIRPSIRVSCSSK